MGEGRAAIGPDDQITGAVPVAPHCGDPSSNQATTLQSQMIHMTQRPSGRTLTAGQPRGTYGSALAL